MKARKRKTRQVKRPTPARDRQGHFLKTTAAREATVASPDGGVGPDLGPAPAPLHEPASAMETDEEPILDQLKRLFKAADRPTKRSYLAWLQDYLTYTDQVLEPEEWEHA